jgi:hypothetical protein
VACWLPTAVPGFIDATNFDPLNNWLVASPRVHPTSPFGLSVSRMFATSKKKTVLKNFQGDVLRSFNYLHRLNFYSVPPHKEITLEEFELWAIDRLYGTEPPFHVS